MKVRGGYVYSLWWVRGMMSFSAVIGPRQGSPGGYFVWSQAIAPPNPTGRISGEGRGPGENGPHAGAISVVKA